MAILKQKGDSFGDHVNIPNSVGEKLMDKWLGNSHKGVQKADKSDVWKVQSIDGEIHTGEYGKIKNIIITSQKASPKFVKALTAENLRDFENFTLNKYLNENGELTADKEAKLFVDEKLANIEVLPNGHQSIQIKYGKGADYFRTADLIAAWRENRAKIKFAEKKRLEQYDQMAEQV